MTPTWITLGGVLVRAPVTAATNLLLALQCLAYGILLRRSPHRDPVARGWSSFFVLMGVANLAGIPKHGFRHLLAAELLLGCLAVSNVATGVAVLHAQRATLAAGGPPAPGAKARANRLLTADRLPGLQLAVYLAANLVLGPEMLLLIANTLVGLGPVIVVEARRAAAAPPPATPTALPPRASAAIAGGLALSLLTGVVYLVRLSPSPWFNHIDVAHLLMGASFHLIFRGARVEPPLRPPAHAASGGALP